MIKKFQVFQKSYRQYRRFIIIGICFFVHQPAMIVYGRNSDRNILPFHHLNEKLSQNTGTCAFQDSRGFMWFGTRNGLNRYDGNEVVVYKHKPDDSTSLSANVINQLTEDKEGNLWVLDEISVNMYNRDRDNFIRFDKEEENPDKIPENTVSDIFEDSEGILWISAGYLCRYNPETRNFTRYPNPDVVLTRTWMDYYHRILEDKQNNLWNICHKDIFLFNRSTGKYTRILKGDTLRYTPKDDWWFEDGLADVNGDIWLGTRNSGILKAEFDGKNLKLIHCVKDMIPQEGTISHLYQDRQHYIWFTVENGGVFSLNPETDDYTSYTYTPDEEGSLSGVSVWSIYEDHAGRMWFGIFNTGFDYSDPYGIKFKHYGYNNYKNSISYNTVTAFNEDAKGNIWIGTDGGGLNYYDRSRNHFTHFRQGSNSAQSINSDAVMCLSNDNKGNLWIGQWNGGINIFNKESGRTESLTMENSGLNDNNILALLQSSGGDVYIGTSSQGLNIYNAESDTWRYHNYDREDPQSLITSCITVLVEDHQKQVWIGTIDGLDLMQYDRNGRVYFKHYLNDGSPGCLSNNRIESVCFDKQNRMWIGTADGLNLYDETEDNFKVFREKDGLTNSTIRGIVNDDQGNLWMGTLNGLSKLDTKKMKFRNYGKEDGVQGNEFTRNSNFRTSKGELLLGGSNGFNIITPDRVNDNPYLPPVVITAFRIFNNTVLPGESPLLTKQISETKEITLTRKHQVFSFEFAALNFTHPQKNKYAYKLEGFDKNWYYIGNSNSATFTNIPPGNYTFRVKASNNDEVWNEKGVSLRLTILPPWWKTYWFRISAFIILLTLLTGIYYYRLAKIKRDNRKLELQVKGRTKEIREKNLSLSLTTKRLNETNALLEEKQQRIQQQAEELLSQRDELAEVNDIKDRLFAIIAHDLKGPLNTLKGFTELFKMKYDNFSDAKRRQMIDLINQSSGNAYELIVDLLNWARAQRKSIQTDLVLTDIMVVIDRSIQVLRDFAENKNISVSYTPEKEKIMAELDVNMMNAVVRNLVTNAIKFTEEDGEIKVTAVSDNNEVVVSVKDNGTGISEEDRQKLFHKNAHISTFGTKNEKGTGIGLIMCKDFIDMHHGRIWVESEPDKGSTFSFSIPVKHSDGNASEQG